MNSSDPSNERLRELGSFIKHARDQKASDEMIRHLLVSRGWSDKEICTGFAAAILEMPIPESRGKGGAREAFYHLSAFACLYVSTIAFIFLLFSLLDVTFPDAAQESWGSDWKFTSIRLHLSSVIVFFPLYLVFAWLIHGEVQRGKLVAGGGVERWLTHLTLFAIVMTSLIDAATLLFQFLEGTMTRVVLLKALILFAVMCGAFVYIWRGMIPWSTGAKARAEVGRN